MVRLRKGKVALKIDLLFLDTFSYHSSSKIHQNFTLEKLKASVASRTYFNQFHQMALIESISYIEIYVINLIKCQIDVNSVIAYIIKCIKNRHFIPKLIPIHFTKKDKAELF